MICSCRPFCRYLKQGYLVGIKYKYALAAHHGEHGRKAHNRVVIGADKGTGKGLPEVNK